ncbi:Rap1 GTPase-activating protein 1, variant 2 [Balamuthia mandrillaris]
MQRERAPSAPPEAVYPQNTWADWRKLVWDKACKYADLDSASQAIPVTKFCASFLASLPGQFDEKDQVSLAVIFSDYGEQEEEFPVVTRKKFEQFLQRFGPPEHSVEKVRDILDKGKVWFHGAQSRQASERLLLERDKEGSFLLRYSSLEGAFTVDYIKRKKICHFNNIRNDPEGGVKVFVGKGAQQQTYKFTSMHAFIHKNEHIFIHPCLNPRSHFQWLKLRIPSSSSDGSFGEATSDEETGPAGSTPEERVKNAIQAAFKTENKGTLSLRGLGITGTLPAHICRLTYVVYLDLAKNALTSLHEDLGKLHMLRTLNVSHNQLTSLPGNIFADLPKLTSLLASNNQIDALPASLFEARTLTYLDVSNNALTTLPDDISQLVQLGFLDVSMNHLQTLPTTINKLEKLEELNLRGNSLSELAPKLAALPTLMFLDVSDNKLEHVPVELISILKENPRFSLIYSGNPLAAEDKEEIQRCQAMEAGSVGLPLSQSQDIQQILKLAEEKKASFIEEHLSAGEREQELEKASGMFRTQMLLGGSSSSSSSSTSLWLESMGMWIEEGQVGAATEPTLMLQEHINIFDYRRYFYMKTVHANIIGNDKHLGPVCISISKEPGAPIDGGIGALSASYKDGVYRVLLRTKQGDRRLEIPASSVRQRNKEHYARSDDLLAALKDLLNPTFSPRHLYVIRDQRSHKEFAVLEDRLKSNSSKFGIIYAKEGQDETAMYNNVTGSQGFEDFILCLGDKINMLGWDKYRGDFSNKAAQDSVYTVYKDHEIMFHVSTYLRHMTCTDAHGQQWERKRFIGNDIVVIIFYEGETPIDPNTFQSNFNRILTFLFIVLPFVQFFV